MVTRTHVRRRRLAAVATVAALGGLWTGRLARGADGESTRPVAHRTYVVRTGDSVWGIAARLSDGGDPRELIDAIQTANHLDPAALRPGQSLVIPSV